MPSTPASMARRASSGWQMPLRIRGNFVMDRSHGMSFQVNEFPKMLTQCMTALRGSASTSASTFARKCGSLM